MKRVFCKTIGRDEIAFFLEANGKEYYLCAGRYYQSVWNYFVGGVSIDRIFSNGGKHSHAIRHVKQKLPTYIKYVEGENDLQILDKTIAKRNHSHKSKYYVCKAYHDLASYEEVA